MPIAFYTSKGIFYILKPIIHPIGVIIINVLLTLHPKGCKINTDNTTRSTYMNPIAEFVKENRKAAGLTQEQFALRSGLGLRFVRELEQGKETVRMDKVNVALAMFNAQAVAGKKK